MENKQEMLNKFFTEDGERVICQYCLKTFRRIMPQHLALHDMTYEEYKAKFPDAPLDHIEYEKFGGVKKSKIQQNAEQPKIDLEPSQNSEDIFKQFEDNISSEDILKQMALEAQRKKELQKIHTKPVETNPFVIARERVRFHYKQEIINFLKQIFPGLKNNYLFRKHNLEGHVLYSFITDMADPQKRTVIEFPDAFWHNNDFYYDSVKKEKLLNESKWRYIQINGQSPTNEEIIEVINKYI